MKAYPRFFLGRLDYTDIGIGTQNRWRLDNPFGYQTKAGRGIVVPAGFEWDGASIPRFLWDRLGGPMSSGNGEASLVHDWMRAHRVEPTDDGITFTLDYGDAMFREILLYRGKSRWKAWWMWAGVRVHGVVLYGRGCLASIA